MIWMTYLLNHMSLLQIRFYLMEYSLDNMAKEREEIQICQDFAMIIAEKDTIVMA